MDKTGDPLFPCIAGERWGYIDARGTWAIAPAFREAKEFHEGLAAVETAEGRWGYINRAGGLAITARFAFANRFSDGLAVVLEHPAEKHRYMFLNAKGETVAVVDKYPWIDHQFSEGRIGFRVQDDSRDGHYGFLDAQGLVAVKPISTGSRRFSDGLAVVKIDGKFGYIDRQGHLAIQPRFDEANSFADGLAPVQSGGKWGYIDIHGEYVVDPKFVSAEPFSEGLAAVLDGTTWAFMDKTGKIRFQPQRAPHQQNHRPAFSDGVCALNDSKGYDSFWSIIDPQGKIVGRFAERGPPFLIGKFRDGLAPLFFDATPRDSSRASPMIFVGYVRKTGERVKVAEPASK